MTLNVRELIAASATAYRNLWRFLCEVALQAFAPVASLGFKAVLAAGAITAVTLGLKGAHVAWSRFSN